MDYKVLNARYSMNGDSNLTTVTPHKNKGKDESAIFVGNRYYPMAFSKQNRRDTWQAVQWLLYPNEWNFILRGDDFDGPVRYPTYHDLVNALADKFMETPPETVLRAYNDEDENLLVGKRAYLDYLRRCPHEKAIARRCFLDMFTWGDGFRRYQYVKRGRTVQMPNEDRPEERLLFKDVASTRVDFRNFFIDEDALMLHDPTGLQGARDIIIETLLPYSKFVAMYQDMPGFNIAGVRPLPFLEAQGIDYKPTNSRETLEQSQSMYVKLYEYENVEENLYIVVANHQTIHEGKFSEDRGVTKFDVVNYKYDARNDSFWGNCLAELVAPHIYLKDQLLNLEIMNLKLTLQPVLAVSGDFGFNPRVHKLGPGQVWRAGGTLNGKINDNIQPLIAGNPKTNVYQMMDRIDNEITTTSRADLRQLNSFKDQTATEVLATGQSMNAHNEFIASVNEIEAETVASELTLELMRSFMQSDTKDGHKIRRIPISNYRVRQAEDGSAVFIQKNGYNDLFALTDDMIDVECRVEVLDKRGQKVANAEFVGRVMQFLPLLGNFMQLDPSIGKAVNIMGIMEQLVDAIGLDQAKSFNEDQSMYEDEHEMLKEEILLGHMVQLPQDESRRESMARMKYLLSMYKQMGDDFDKQQQAAFDHAMQQVASNIMDDHLSRKYQIAQAAGMPVDEMVQAQAGPQQAPGQQATAVQNQAFPGSMGTPMAVSSNESGQNMSIRSNMRPMPNVDTKMMGPSNRDIMQQ